MNGMTMTQNAIALIEEAVAWPECGPGEATWTAWLQRVESDIVTSALGEHSSDEASKLLKRVAHHDCLCRTEWDAWLHDAKAYVGISMEHAKESLTPEQVNALLTFARRHGHYWKKKLAELWQSGRDSREPEGPLLRQIRNGGGHSLLVGFRASGDGR